MSKMKLPRNAKLDIVSSRALEATVVSFNISTNDSFADTFLINIVCKANCYFEDKYSQLYFLSLLNKVIQKKRHDTFISFICLFLHLAIYSIS